eukprot:11179485-Lingulodinium_polyedra.AAC.1
MRSCCAPCPSFSFRPRSSVVLVFSGLSVAPAPFVVLHACVAFVPCGSYLGSIVGQLQPAAGNTDRVR